MFSRRTRWSYEGDRIGEAVAARLEPLIDLTVSNPTQVGLPLPTPLLAALSHPRSLAYEPEPFGDPRARQAVARTRDFDPSRVVLSASTSEAYANLFRLLCDPGDRVLVPVPSYPLFELLAGLEGVGVDTCPTHAFDDFALDVDAIEASLAPNTRAVIVVSPNNPTGRVLRRSELEALGSLCLRRNLALIVDEVFADWIHSDAPDLVPTACGFDACLSFVLGGLSKSLLLPQMKVGWTFVQGPDELVQAALERLEMIADAALSVSAPVQLALPEWLPFAEEIQAPLRSRLARNRRRLTELAVGSAVSVWPSDAGWSALLRVPRTVDEERWVVSLIEDAGVRVAPGYFFDFPSQGWLVVSLLPEEAMFEDAARRLVACVDGRLP